MAHPPPHFPLVDNAQSCSFNATCMGLGSNLHQLQAHRPNLPSITQIPQDHRVIGNPCHLNSSLFSLHLGFSSLQMVLLIGHQVTWYITHERGVQIPLHLHCHTQIVLSYSFYSYDETP